MDPVNNDNAPPQAENRAASSAPNPGDPAAVLAKLEGLQEQISKTHAAMERIERSRQIDQAVRAARAVDPGIATELVEHTLAEGRGKVDIQAALEQVRRKRPGLFKQGSSPQSAMSPRPEAGGTAPDDSLAKLAQRIGSGDHRSIMEYMRARRNR